MHSLLINCVQLTADDAEQTMDVSIYFGVYLLHWPQSLMSIFFSKTDNLSKIAIYKLYLEVEVLGLNLTIREDRIFKR